MELQLGSPHVLKELSQDFVRSVGDVRECRINDFSAKVWTAVVERYINGELALNVILKKTVREVDKFTLPEYCRVVLYWPGFHAFNRDIPEINRGWWKRNLKAGHQCARELKSAVLVSIREFAEMPERAVPTLPCAAVCYRERLCRSEPVNMDSVNPWGKFSFYVPPKICLRHVDRELNPGWLPLSVFSHPPASPSVQLEDEVIKTAPQIVDDLANQHAPHWFGLVDTIEKNGDWKESMVLCAELNTWFVRVALPIGTKFRIESVKLVPGPFTFESYPV